MIRGGLGAVFGGGRLVGLGGGRLVRGGTSAAAVRPSVSAAGGASAAGSSTAGASTVGWSAPAASARRFERRGLVGLGARRGPAGRLVGGLEVELGLLLALGLALAGLGQRALLLGRRHVGRADVVADRAADVGGLGRGGGLLLGFVDGGGSCASGAGTGVAVLATGPGAS